MVYIWNFYVHMLGFLVYIDHIPNPIFISVFGTVELHINMRAGMQSVISVLSARLQALGRKVASFL